MSGARRTAKAPRAIQTAQEAIRVAQEAVDRARDPSIREPRRVPVKLHGRYADLVTRDASEINILFLSTHALAGQALETMGRQESAAFMTAIESMAKVGCRLADRIARACGDVGFGNFERDMETPMLEPEPAQT